MKFNFLKAAFAGVIFSVSGFANAGLIDIDDWHLTTDSLGGLRQAELSEDVFFAVSKSNVYDPNSTYEMLTGYHWASSEEYMSLIGESGGSTHAYYNKGGWSGYSWEGAARYQFMFTDTAVTNRIQHAGNYETARHVRDITSYHTSYGNNYFAGLVLVKDPVLQSALGTAIPEPTSLAIFALGLMGLASRRFKK